MIKRLRTSLTGWRATAEEPQEAEDQPEPPAEVPSEEVADPWRLSALHLDVGNELSRTFGREALKAERKVRAEANKSHDAAFAKRELAKRAALAGGGRGRLIAPRETWPPFGGGLSMEVDHAATENGGGGTPARSGR